MSKKEEETKKIYEVVEVPTETARVIRNNETGETMDIQISLAQILNELKELKSVLK